MLKFIKLAWRNTWRNSRRTLIATITIVMSMILLVFFQAFMDGTDQAIYGNMVRLYGGHVLIHAPGYREKATRLPMLPVEDADAILAAIRSQPNVLAYRFGAIANPAGIDKRLKEFHVLISPVEHSLHP